MNSSSDQLSGRNDTGLQVVPAFSLAAVLGKTSTIVGKNFLFFFKILLVPAVSTLLIGLAAGQIIIGSPDAAESVNPRLLAITMSTGDWIAVGIGSFIAAGFLFYSIGAMVHAASAAASQNEIGVWQAFRSVRFDTLWLLWIQLIATLITSSVFFPAAVLLWILIGSAVPVALLENLSPNQALDRSWTLGNGNRGWITLLNLILTVFVVVVPTTIILGAYSAGLPLAIIDVPAIARLIFAIPLTALLLMPLAYLFSGLTVAYLHLRREAMPLHARAATYVN